MEKNLLRAYQENPEEWQRLLLDEIRQNLGVDRLDERVEKAFLSVHRHLYIPEYHAVDAYNAGLAIVLNAEEATRFSLNKAHSLGISDELLNSLPSSDYNMLLRYLGREQVITTSMPTIIALILNEGLPEPDGNRSDYQAFEIGSGSGYVTALLAKTEAFKNVIGIEVSDNMARKSVKNLKSDHIRGVTIIKDNALKWLRANKKYTETFRTIIVSASVNDPSIIREVGKYLEVGGKMIAPVIVNSKTHPLKIGQLPQLKLSVAENETNLMSFTRAPKSLIGKTILNNVYFVNLK